jgi:hypothetical protein
MRAYLLTVLKETEVVWGGKQVFAVGERHDEPVDAKAHRLGELLQSLQELVNGPFTSLHSAHGSLQMFFCLHLGFA